MANFRNIKECIVILLVMACFICNAQYTLSLQHQALTTKLTQQIDNFQTKEALLLCDSLITEGEKANNIGLLAVVYNMKGTVCREESNIKEAITCFIKAISYNEIRKNQKALSDNYVNLGSVYSFIGERKIALTYYFKAIPIFKKQKNFNDLSVLYNNIGNIYESDKQLENADHYFRKSLTEALKNKIPINLARVYHNLANCQFETGKADSALVYYALSLKNLEKFEEGPGHLFNYTRLADVYLSKNDLGKAEMYMTKAEPIAAQMNSFEDLMIIYTLLSRIHQKKGDYKKAYHYSNLTSNYKDSIKNENAHDEVVKIQYETELKNQKKEQELVRQNQEAINKAKIESKNKNLILSYTALGLAIVMGLVVLNGYRAKQKANKIISKQKEEVEHKNSEILSSINYAKRIQYALLAHKEFMGQHLPEQFVYFNPKDIVSGDFYWATKHGSKFYLAVCDSTGHGVPGAFMSLLNIGFLTEAINEKNIEEPGKVFNHVRSRLVESISKEGQKDGFDGILISIDEKTKEIKYAAANNAPVLISEGTIKELQKDSMPVGIGERKDLFTTHTLEIKKGEVLYLYTDGYADQFGGPKGKKFKYKQLNERLVQLSTLEMDKQKDELRLGFNAWKGDLEQVDDVLVIGIRF